MPDKEIADDIVFKKENVNTLSFDNIKVLNSMGIDLLLNEKYKPNIPEPTAIQFPMRYSEDDMT